MFRDIEVFALFVASLCHDIDHRGTTNSYQVASNSVLASLYSSEGSVLEVSARLSCTLAIKMHLSAYIHNQCWLYNNVRNKKFFQRHHFAQTICILNTDGCNLFENLSSRDYERVLDLIRDIILATDLAHHLRILGRLKEVAAGNHNVLEIDTKFYSQRVLIAKIANIES